MSRGYIKTPVTLTWSIINKHIFLHSIWQHFNLLFSVLPPLLSVGALEAESKQSIHVAFFILFERNLNSFPSFIFVIVSVTWWLLLGGAVVSEIKRKQWRSPVEKMMAWLFLLTSKCVCVTGLVISCEWVCFWVSVSVCAWLATIGGN